MSVYPAALPTVRPAVRSAFEQGSGGGAASIIAGLFAQGQQGFWLPFTDFDSLSQDSAGTLPYTALEQPVGRVLDRSGRGNHASQVTSTARGVVSARVNRRSNSQSFTGLTAYMVTFANISITDFAGLDSGFSWMETAGNGDHRIEGFETSVGARQRVTVLLKPQGGVTKVVVAEYGGDKSIFNLVTHSVTPFPGSTCTITSLANGYFEITDERVWKYNNRGGLILLTDGGAQIYTGDPSRGLHIAGVDVRAATDASLPYQRVNTATDYDAVGFPKFLRLDGTDDFYTCGGGGSTTGFYYSDVIRPMGGAGTRRVIWSDRSGNNGYELAISASDKLEFSAGNGSAITTVASTASVVVTEGKRYEVMDDGTNLSVQIDGSAPVTIARPVVTAGSPTITLYRGASAGYFNGQATEPIYRAGPPPSASERATIMGYQKQKAGL